MDFNPVIVGDHEIAKLYFTRAKRMLNALERTGLTKDLWANQEIIIIAKVIGAIKKAIFIVRGEFIVLYVKQVTFDNIAQIWGWDGQSHALAVTIDFNDIPTPLAVGAIEISEFLAKDSYFYFRSAPSALAAPLAEYPVHSRPRSVLADPWQALVYEGAPINFRQLHRGEDRDFFYTTTDGIFYGDDDGAAIHERLWADPTREIKHRFTLPDNGLVWPAVGFDAHFSAYFSVVGNDIYIVSTDGVLQSTVAIYQLHADMSAFEAWVVFDNTYAGGSSQRQFGALFYNTVNTTMGFTISEWFDFDGDPSDREFLYALDTTVLVDFLPGDYMGYSGRTTENETRVTKAWVVAENIYALHLENTAQPVAGYRPDGLFRIDLTNPTPAITLVYQAADGIGMRSPIVNPYRPNLVLCGERTRGAATNQRVLMIDVLTGAQTVVTEETNHLTSSQFVF